MAGRRLNPEKLARLLASDGFVLNLPEAKKNGIYFIRPSKLERLCEHVLISAENPFYAEAVISAASFTSCHNCVSERDNRLRALLSGNSTYRNSRLLTAADAKAWQQKLVRNASTYCASAANELGPALTRRLLPVFGAVDMYVQLLGDPFAILDREFAFVNEAPIAERAIAEGLGNVAYRFLHVNSEDAKLAGTILARFGRRGGRAAGAVW